MTADAAVHPVKTRKDEIVYWISTGIVCAVLALSIPNVPRKVKEFAYFGFAITLVSASIAHFSRGDARLSILFVIDPLIFLVILIVSYSYFQKTDTRIGSAPRARAS